MLSSFYIASPEPHARYSLPINDTSVIIPRAKYDLYSPIPLHQNDITQSKFSFPTHPSRGVFFTTHIFSFIENQKTLLFWNHQIHHTHHKPHQILRYPTPKTTLSPHHSKSIDSIITCFHHFMPRNRFVFNKFCFSLI